jgi:hypothetical protein
MYANLKYNLSQTPVQQSNKKSVFVAPRIFLGDPILFLSRFFISTGNTEFHQNSDPLRLSKFERELGKRNGTSESEHF